ncbi:MAG: Gfo/Idh/MocA family oxidoreductase [Phycisphaeraceae bacterium]|nr:Gfo/Idh/MocA family oxidoreductase [Phycisphaeraceae bacterium]
MSPSRQRTSRRRFLATTAAASMAATLASGAGGRFARLPQPTVPAGRVRPPRGNEPIRMAVIGTGGMGTGHCSAFTTFAKRGEANVQVVALADPWPENLNKAKKLCEDNQTEVRVDAYEDYREILGRDDIHAVLIASPEHWHAQQAIDAIVAGKDVYVEKPMTLKVEEAIELYKVVKAHPDRIFQVGTQMMRLPKYHEAKKVLATGEFGPPTMSQTSYCRNTPSGEWNYYRVNPNWQPGKDVNWEKWCGPLGLQKWDPYLLNRWRRYKVASTGIIGDLLVHVMTPLMFALDRGWPTRVVAQGQHMIDKAMENHDTVNLLIGFEKEHTMMVAGATNNENGLETLIRCHKANIYLNSRHCVIRPERVFVNDIDERTIECPDIGNDQNVHRLGWLECIRTREPSPSGVELGTQVMVAVDLASRSMWDGRAWGFNTETLAPYPIC